MKIAIYGAGAVGGNIGARLHQSGQEVTLIARGAHLAAIKTNGLRLVNKHPEALSNITLRIPATDDPATLPPQDLVILSCKSYDIPLAAERITPLLGQNTVVLPVGNGIPWWFCEALPGKLAGFRIAALDPNNRIPQFIAPERIVGGLCYLGSGVEAPGVVTCYDKRPKIILGEPSGAVTPRAEALRQIFYDAGFSTSLSDHIRSDIWNKLCWNIAFNPLSVVTGLTSYELATEEPHLTTIRLVMEEMAVLAQALELGIPVDVESHLKAAIRTPGHKTSMLQDHERGKHLEVEAIIGSVVEIATHLGTPAPQITKLAYEVRKFA